MSSSFYLGKSFPLPRLPAELAPLNDTHAIFNWCGHWNIFSSKWPFAYGIRNPARNVYSHIMSQCNCQLITIVIGLCQKV